MSAPLHRDPPIDKWAGDETDTAGPIAAVLLEASNPVDEPLERVAPKIKPRKLTDAEVKEQQAAERDEDAPLPEPPKDGRPVVKLSIEVHRVVDELERALAEHDARMFQRSHRAVLIVGANKCDAETLARKLRVTKPEDVQRLIGANLIRELTPASLLMRITEHVNVQRLKKSEDGEQWLPALVPPEYRAAFLESPSFRHLRPLRGQTETPIMHLDDGSVCSEGYDPVTGYLVVPKVAFPEIPGHH